VTPVDGAEWIAVALAGALLALDHAAWPSVLLSQPIVAGAGLGLLAGHPEAGLAAGAVTQMVCLGLAPVGGVAVPEAWLAGLAAASAAPKDLALLGGGWLDDPRLAAPAVVGIGAAYLGLFALRAQRALQRRLATGLEARLASGDATGVARLHAVGILLHAARGACGAVFVVAFAPGAADLLGRVGVAAPAGRLALAFAATALAACAPRAHRVAWLAGGAAVGFLVGALR
jgi:mannose/fructose/N-acetylgalactosamine-specific phosphotransferase system component IIC